MTILNKDATVVSAAMTDAFGADVPTTQAGLEKEADQTGIFIFSKTSYDLYLKNAAGAWVEYGSISGARESITIPWGSNTAAFFKCADAAAKMHVHRKTGDILYDTTPENDGDDQNTLLTSAGTAAQEAQNYTFPAADGNANQVLTTDGAGTVTWADGGAGTCAASSFTFDGHMIPDTNAAYDLGSAEKKVRHLFLSDNSIKFDGGELGVNDGDLTFNGETVGSGGASTKVSDLATDLVLDSSYNGGVVVVKDFTLVNMIKLPSFSTVGTGYQVKVLMPVNTYSPGVVGTLTIQSDAMDEKMTGLLTRQTNSDGSGWDSTPQAWTKTAVGNGTDDEENTLTLTKTVAGSYVNFCSDGSRWFVDGNIVSWDEGNQYEASADFTKETF